MHAQRFSGPIRPADLDRSDAARAVVVLLHAYAEDAMGAGEPLPDDVMTRLVPTLQGVPNHLALLAACG